METRKVAQAKEGCVRAFLTLLVVSAAFFLLFDATSANADTSVFIKLPSDSSGYVEIPIQGASPTHWLLLNDCYLVLDGYSLPNEKVKYHPEEYGDIFYLQQFNGSKIKFAEQLVYLRLIGNAYGCGKLRKPSETDKAEGVSNSDKQHLKNRQDVLNSIEVNKVVSLIREVVEAALTNSQTTITTRELASRLPNKAEHLCPEHEPTNDELKECLDVTQIKANVENVMNKLSTYPIPPIVQGGTSQRYANRKQFSTFTIKSSLAFSLSAHTALTTAYISVYPATEFITSERLAGWDRVSLDFGVVKPIGDTASEEFKNSESHYMIGFGYDFTENFAIHASDAMGFDNNTTHHNFMVGVSIDLLSLLSKINK